MVIHFKKACYLNLIAPDADLLKFHDCHEFNIQRHTKEANTCLNIFFKYLGCDKENPFRFPEGHSFRGSYQTCHINCPFLQSLIYNPSQNMVIYKLFWISEKLRIQVYTIMERSIYLRYTHNIMASFYLLHDQRSRRSSKNYLSCDLRWKKASMTISEDFCWSIKVMRYPNKLNQIHITFRKPSKIIKHNNSSYESFSQSCRKRHQCVWK